MDNKQFPQNLNIRIESAAETRKKLEVIRRHWRLRSGSEAVRFAIDAFYDVARSAEQTPLPSGVNGPARMGESHNAADKMP